MNDEELVFKNEPLKHNRLINALKKNLEFNEKYVEVLQKQQQEILDKLNTIKSKNGITNG